MRLVGGAEMHGGMGKENTLEDYVEGGSSADVGGYMGAGS